MLGIAYGVAKTKERSRAPTTGFGKSSWPIFMHQVPRVAAALAASCPSKRSGVIRCRPAFTSGRHSCVEVMPFTGYARVRKVQVIHQVSRGRERHEVLHAVLLLVRVVPDGRITS